MSAQTVLEARLRARDDGLVGQLTAAEARAKGVTDGFGRMATSARSAATATGAVAASDRDAARAARDLEAARRAQGQAAQAAARSEKVAATEAQRALSTQSQGYRQLGFQAQDFFVQIGSGQSVMTAFSQQASQVATVLTLMGGEADGSKGKFAQFANFMAGPWGIALGVAIPIVSILTAKLFENSDAAGAAEAAQDALAKRVSNIASFFDLATGAVLRNSQALIANARLQRLDEIDKIKASQSERAGSIRSLVSGSMQGEVRFGGTFGNETGRANVVRSGPSDIVRAIGAAKGDQAKINEALLGLARGGGANSDRARKLLELRGQASFDADRMRTLSLEDESLRTGELVAQLKSGDRKPKKSGGASAQRGAAAATALANFGDSTAEKIARIGESYDPAPRGLDKAFADIRTLDGLIDDLSKRKPPSFEKLIVEAKDARSAVMAGLAQPLDAIQERLVPLPQGVAKAKAAIDELDGVIAALTERKPQGWEELVDRARELKDVAAETASGPLNDILQSSREQRAQQLLLLQGREREAEVLGVMQRLQREMGPLTADQRREVETMVSAEERMNDLLQKRQDIIAIYTGSIGDLRGALEDLFSGGSGGDFLKNTEQMIKRFQGRMLVEGIFGDSLRALEKQARGKSPLDREIDDLAREVNALETETGNSTKALRMFADAVAGAAAVISGRGEIPRTDNAKGSFLGLFPSAKNGASEPEIVVTGGRPASIGGSLMADQTKFLRDIAAAQFDPLAKLFDQYLGTPFFQKLSPVFQGAYSGFFTAGPVGGLLGAVKELPGLPDKLRGTLGKAFEGAQTGTMVAGIGKALGLKTSTMGGQIGGAIGSALPIPGGEIIGSVLGSLVGGLFKKAKTGSATITGVDSDPAISGNSSKFRAAAGDAASGVQGILKQVADALGGELGAFSVSIGVRDGKYRVDPTGAGRTKAKGGVLDFGEDGQAAAMAAAFDAIGDGGITGLSEAVQRALRSNKDIDKALREALKVQEVESILSGMGGELERQFRQFETQAKERVRIATQYGFDVTRIEARNAEDRAKLVDQILSSRVGSLKKLLDDLAFGDLSEGTASERRDKLLAEMAKAKSDAEKGVDGAADKLADLSRRLIETSRDAYGTAGSEYAADRSGAIRSAEAIIAAENERIKAAQQATLDTSKAMQVQNQLTNETNDILAEMRAIMRTGGFAGEAAAAAPFNVSRSVDLS